MADQPQRIQLSRAKGWRMPADAVKVDRSTRWGNPWKVGTPGLFWLPGYPVRDAQVRLSISATDACGLFKILMAVGADNGAVDPYLPSMLNPAGRREAQRQLAAHRAAILAGIEGLRGKDLACWCKPGSPCHADVLLEIANA